MAVGTGTASASGHWPLILIEVVLVFGAVLAFGWWQLRSVKRDQQRSAEARARAAADDPPKVPEERPQPDAESR